MEKTLLYTLIVVMIFCSCHQPQKQAQKQAAPSNRNYATDRDFLKKYSGHLIELQSPDSQSRVLLSADYQGRVMTSTATGDSGLSFGWINYKLIESGERKRQFNPVGGEERFWLGPEGGQYGIYFKKGDSFNIGHWQVPPVIDTESYDLSSSDGQQAVFRKRTSLDNSSGSHFELNIERKIALLDRNQIEDKLHLRLPGTVHAVGFETDNSIVNSSDKAWNKEGGLLSIWLLGMMTPGPDTKILIPFLPVKNARDLITDNYFGKIAPDRLKVGDSLLIFTCDGHSRGKLGLSPLIAKGMAASLDYKNNTLSIILFPVDRQGLYVNSKWELQKEPFKGDVVNSYNDGPLADGTQMGPFYEIESSSAAKELKPGEKEEHIQTTIHLQGDLKSLKSIAQQLLGAEFK